MILFFCMNISSISDAIRGFFEDRERKKKEQLWGNERENEPKVSGSEYLVEQINKKQEPNTNTFSNKTQTKSNFVFRPPDPSNR